MNRFIMHLLVVATLSVAQSSVAASLSDGVKLDCPKTGSWRFKVSTCTVEPGVEIEPMTPPDVAFDAVYSTWYDFHQDVSADGVERECAIAARLGIEGVIAPRQAICARNIWCLQTDVLLVRNRMIAVDSLAWICDNTLTKKSE